MVIILSRVQKLWEVYRGEEDSKVRERLLMVIWMKEGASSYEVGRRLNCPHSKAMYWKKRFDEGGYTALKTRPRPGKPPKVLEEDMDRIRNKLMSGDYWQTQWVLDLIYQETGVVYSERHVVRLLHAWGFERIRPRKEHVQADEKERKKFSKKPDNYWVLSQRAGM